MKRKEVDFSKTNLWDKEYPTHNLATCLEKCRERNGVAVHFTKWLHLIQCEKAVPTNGKICLFAADFLG
ncbi:hypothetical protein FXV77_03140 [Sphingobacterium phlebotomi]|uniref:Uncharacterized protein n=1 Tax=Sphingobacterium phlebotomi TaxID=2605433 RepID=A0A5D4HER3_9SPHI|nr:hypothetical protein [Sphingobacterium phlebotomi]TYR38289.1 hypothetical protein FXV77_03140 [Sphingobacterium phlebotomi]